MKTLEGPPRGLCLMFILMVVFLQSRGINKCLTETHLSASAALQDNTSDCRIPQSEMGQRQQAKLKTMAVTKPFSGWRSTCEQACMFVSDNGCLADVSVLVHGQIYDFTQLLLLIGVVLYLAKPGNTAVARSLMGQPPIIL